MKPTLTFKCPFPAANGTTGHRNSTSLLSQLFQEPAATVSASIAWADVKNKASFSLTFGNPVVLIQGPKAFDMLLRLRLGGAERDPRLIAVLAALVWVSETDIYISSMSTISYSKR